MKKAMRIIAGEIALPANCPVKKGAMVLIEIRDVSLIDAPSIVVAHTKLTNVNIQPGGRVVFSLLVPEVSDNRSLEIRVHISLSRNGRIKPGDLLTTASYPVPTRGTLDCIVVPVTLI